MSDLNSSFENESPVIRKGRRMKKPSLKALESLYTSKLKTSGYVANIESDDEQPFLSSDDNEDKSTDNIEKPKLFHDNELVHGEEIFQIRSSKKRDGLARKVVEACSLKKRDKMKKTIAMKMMEDDSESEYECSNSSSSEDDAEESEKSSSEDEEPLAKQVGKITASKLSNIKLRPRKVASNKYTIMTDEYFSNSASSKICTSNNTLEKLETPRLPQYQLQALLANMQLTKSHQKAISSLTQSNKNQFKKWLYLLNENFNILLFGLGSKRNILKSFHMDYLKDLPVIVVNGFFPTLSIKNILDSIIVDLLELKENPGNIFEACDLIEQEFNRIPESHLYLIVHNIEGDMIRNSKAQNVLARLAAVRNIHLIASIDHINAPIIWDHNKLSKFNYIWFDVTSFLPYLEETSFERSMMVQKTGNLALSSLRNVFLSLTTNSKSIYLLIVKHQLENSSKYYQGIAFKDLYMACREAFIVSSDLALRAQLTEFVDHKMVKLKRSADGTEQLQIPLANALLQKFLDEQN